MICNSYQSYESKNRDYCSHFSLIFKTTSKFLIPFVRLILGRVPFVRLILGRVGVEGFTEPQRKTDTRYEFDFKAVLKGLLCK